jgi:hypothetical protein
MGNHGTKGGFMENKNYQIKINHYDNEVRKVADCSIKLTIPPKIDKYTG